MIMIAGNLARSQQSMADVALGRIAVSVYQAFSQGYVRITTTDPEVDPAVEERMLSDPRDLVRLRDGVRRLRDICLQPGVTDIAHRVEYGASGRPMDEPFSDAELDDWLFAECSDAQHASGTCRMGAPDDARSVVDPECRVIGCTGLAGDRRLDHAGSPARQHPSDHGRHRRAHGGSVEGRAVSGNAADHRLTNETPRTNGDKGDQSRANFGRRGPSLQTATISECRYRWLRLPATTFVITRSPSRFNRRDGF